MNTKNDTTEHAATTEGTPEVTPETKVRKAVRVKVGKAKASAKAKAKSAKAKAPAKPKTTKYISRDQFLGEHMRVAQYQDYTLSINNGLRRRLTDEQLCADWQTQFPNAVQFTTFHVVGVRRDYNAGIHSKAFTGKKIGDQISVAYVLVDGRRVRANSGIAAKASEKAKKVAKSTSKDDTAAA